MVKGKDDLNWRANNTEEFDNQDWDSDGDIHAPGNPIIDFNSGLQHQNMLRQLAQNEFLMKKDIGIYQPTKGDKV